jgi:DNA-binding transcriptional ArsR family regulator
MDTQAEQYELAHPGEEAVELTAVLSALAEPVRLTIVHTVADHAAEGGISCLDVWEKSGLTATKSTMSHHYKVLREAGLVVMWWVGAKKHVRLRRELMDVRWPGLLDAVLADTKAPLPVRAHEKPRTDAARAV